MLVTGVQAVGAKGVTAIQGSVVDVKSANDAARGGVDGHAESGHAVKAGEPQPVVFPRSGLPIDHRPVEMRRHHAQTRYHRDGGGRDDAA